jgi:competence protein ComEA
MAFINLLPLAEGSRELNQPKRFNLLHGVFFMKNILSAFVFTAAIFSSSVFAADTPANPVAATPAPAAAKPAAVAPQEAININTADAQALTKLNGIGAKKAEAIVAWRKANGSFKSVDQLAEVKGIGAKTVDKNRKNIRI